MGSRSTKVAPPRVKAVASLVAPTHEKSNNTNDPGTCQAYAFQLAQVSSHMSQPCDNNDIQSSVLKITSPRRRYSEPARIAAMATELNVHGEQHLAAFESFVVERDLMAIDVIEEVVANINTTTPVQEEPVKSEEPEVQCIACCTLLPKETDVNYSREVAKPCRSCNNAYCVSCVRDMFLEACKDFSRMPVRCCTQIHLHYAKPYLSAEEISEYKLRYEEWSTPKPFYCPIPTCSAFIAERLLPQQKKLDSGIGIPASSDFQCPKCESNICADCRQTAHPNSLCATLDFGVDPDTAALLKAWGYKRCPKCSQGLKRMYGCNHMECRCGAHFCWGCMKSRDECEGGCYEDDDEDDNESFFEPDESEFLPGLDYDEPDEAQATGDNDAVRSGATFQAAEQDATDASTTSCPVRRPRNLDGGSAHYWERQDLDFGEEPTDRGEDMTWNCDHFFEPYAITLSEAIATPPSTHEAECVKCWRTIQPDIETSQATKIGSGTARAPSTASVRGRGGRRGRGAVARQHPTTYMPPRGLVHSDATVGTAPHLTMRLPAVISGSPEARSDSMEGVHLGLEAVASEPGLVAKSKTITSTSNIFQGPSTTYSVAQECTNCSLLVCRSCADSILARQTATAAGEEAEDETQPEVETASEEEPRTGSQISVPSDNDDDDDNSQPPPSLFD